MATTSAHTSLHQRSKSLRAPTSNSLRSLQSSTQQPLAGPPLPASTFSGPSHLSLFLTNLRLLELDKRTDWPDITPLTFSTKDSHQDQKRRIQCVEWALYELFEIWDPEETQNKLRPFFPPIEQLQSLNLRAALLRCLEQVKKDGVLGRDTVLRKTMLDECKGDRLEEVLYAFSTAVLKKVVQENGAGTGAVAQQLAIANLSYTSERTTLSTLTLAHKASITRRLADKGRLHANYKDFDGLLKLKDRQLTRRLEQLKISIEERGDSETISKEEADGLQMRVQSNWSGNKEWLQTILQGDTRFESDGLLAKSYDNIWEHVENGSIGEIEYQQRAGLLEQLEARVRDQNHRLEKWRAFGKTLPSHLPDSVKSEIPDTKDKPKSLDLGFGTHEGLQIPRSPVKTDSTWQPLEEYAQMIENLKTDLADVGKPKRRKNRSSIGTVPIQEIGEIKSSVSADSLSQIAQSENREQNISSDGSDEEFPHSEPLDESSSQTPTTADLQKRNFSSAETAVDTRETPASSDTESEKPSSPTATRSISTYSAMPPPSPPSPPSPSTSPQAEQILASMATTSPSPIKPRHVLSLAERTRLSMSRTSTSRGRQGNVREFLDDLDEDDVLPLPKPPKDVAHSSTDKLRNVPGNIERKPSEDSAGTSHEESATSQADKHAALIERTRKSMSNSATVAKAAQVERRRSIKAAAREKRKSYLPKQRAVEEQDEDDSADMSLDLEEKRRLIEGDGEVDYEAVFKSRPRIKTSPERSPVRTWEEMGGYEQGSSSPVEI